MINKKRIGKYLKELRLKKIRKKDGKSFSQEDLVLEFSDKGIDISVNAIAEWERGSTLPSPDNLEMLSEIYNRTIDEILDGEDSNDIDYSEIYFLADEHWGMKYDQKANLYLIRNEQIKLITSRFKEMLLIRIDRVFSSNEENEFRFLFNNFYHASTYVDEYTTIDVNDQYIRVKDALNGLLTEIRNMNPEEKYWEIQKLFVENKELWFGFRLDVLDLNNEPILQERFNDIEDWQKDMLLAMFQNIEPYDENPSAFGSRYYKNFEEKNGEYNHEMKVKSEMKELITHGASINKYFFNVKKGYYETHRIIDRLEELYNLCLKPIEVHLVDEEGKINAYKIENNAKNRFLNKYYFSLRGCLKGYGCGNDYSDIDEIYKWFNTHDEVPEEYYLEEAKKRNIDINQDKKYWMADVKRLDSSLEKCLNEYKAIEKSIAEGLIEIDKLKEMLQSGEKEYKIHKYEIIGGTDEESIRDYIEFWKSKIDYNEYLKGRDRDLTKELLSDLDKLSLEEIKGKYFEMEVIEDE